MRISEKVQHWKERKEKVIGLCGFGFLKFALSFWNKLLSC